jgi:dipeptidyl aminopeptidase/acylaminoacyl peptidase
MGFSAGGHVCADLLTRFAFPAYTPVDAADRLSARPDAAAPIYPVISMTAPFAHAGSRRNLIGENATPALERRHSPHLNVPADAPPCFLLHADDDASVPVGNTLLLREALRARNIPVETHLFPDGGHGFGLRLARGHSVEHWPDLFIAWAIRQGLWS